MFILRKLSLIQNFTHLLSVTISFQYSNSNQDAIYSWKLLLLFLVNISCTSCWSVLCVYVWRVISAGEVCFAMNCPSQVIFFTTKGSESGSVLGLLGRSTSFQHIFLFDRNVWQRSSASCPADLGPLWPLLEEFPPFLQRYEAASFSTQLWQKPPVSRLKRLLNLLALFVRLLLTSLDRLCRTALTPEMEEVVFCKCPATS